MGRQRSWDVIRILQAVFSLGGVRLPRRDTRLALRLVGAAALIVEGLSLFLAIKRGDGSAVASSTADILLDKMPPAVGWLIDPWGMAFTVALGVAGGLGLRQWRRRRRARDFAWR